MTRIQWDDDWLCSRSPRRINNRMLIWIDRHTQLCHQQQSVVYVFYGQPRINSVPDSHPGHVNRRPNADIHFALISAAC